MIGVGLLLTLAGVVFSGVCHRRQMMKLEAEAQVAYWAEMANQNQAAGERRELITRVWSGAATENDILEITRWAEPPVGRP